MASWGPVSSKQRSSALLDVPTISEAGVAGFEESFWSGIWVPAGTPSAVVDKLARDVSLVLAMPDLRDRIQQLGSEPMRMAQPDFSRFVKGELEETALLVKTAGIKLE